MCKKITDRSSSVKILGELNRASSILRDVFNDTFTSIQIDDEELYNQKGLFARNCTFKQSIVKFYQSNDTPFLKIQHRDRSRLHSRNSFHE
jgi:ribonuclease G